MTESGQNLPFTSKKKWWLKNIARHDLNALTQVK